MSSISLVQIGILRSIHRLQLDFQAIQNALEALRVSILPYGARHAARYFDLPWFAEHRDPFDRMIIATALEEHLPMITNDAKSLLYTNLNVVW
jgi:PIN domain nuclease of toxin-antitoxin system